MLTRDLDRIREAYKRRHPEATRRAYNPSHPHQAEEKHTTTQDKHIKSIRYSGFDGTIQPSLLHQVLHVLLCLLE